MFCNAALQGVMMVPGNGFGAVLYKYKASRHTYTV